MAIRSVGDNPLLTGVNLVDSVATAFTVRLLMILRSIFRIFCTAASGYSTLAPRTSKKTREDSPHEC
jgi:hypothetical protein